ncbi:MAG: ArsR family transcriptional regulator [Candidatus Omnitrophica bacterium]|nr:ArsR family transcriptional regulator [Candidatus Omnitrophota bacterium]
MHLKIVPGLSRQTCNVNQLAEKLRLPQSLVSQHLALLRSRGILAPEKKGIPPYSRVRKMRSLLPKQRNSHGYSQCEQPVKTSPGIPLSHWKIWVYAGRRVLTTNRWQDRQAPTAHLSPN